MVQAEAVRQLTYIQAINEALRQEMERDPTVFVMGEDIAGGGGRPGKRDAWGGPMRLTKGLIGQFGPERVRDTPISEAGFVGAGVGAAASGLRPVVDLMYVGFYGVCADQITNNAAKIHYMFGGKVNIPLTIITRDRRGHQLGGPAFGDAILGVYALSRTEMSVSLQPVQRQGAAGRCNPRQRPCNRVQQPAADGVP